MILDYNRNDMFLAGLRTVVEEKKKQNVASHVLDIGLFIIFIFITVFLGKI